MAGGDMVVPLSTLTFKAETAYFTSSDRRSDEYVLYVAQLERQMGEWNFIAGYAGEVVTEHRSAPTSSPVRGFARAAFGKVGYTIDVNRSFSVDAAVRQNGKGVWIRPEYTQALGQHWRLTVSVAVIRGTDSDFIGRYRRNQFVTLRLRYSF